MAILTIPSITKGQSNVINLSKSELALNAKVIADSYFSVQSNWNKIIVTYQCDSGKQKNDCIFDASLGSPVGDFDVSSIARDGNWEVQSLTIMDFDNGYLKLLRGDLTTAEFDIVLSSVVSGFSETLKSASAILSNNNQTASITGTNNQRAYMLPAISVDDGGKHYLEFNIDSYNGYLGVGISQLASDPTSFSNSSAGDPNGGWNSRFTSTEYNGLLANGVNEGLTAIAGWGSNAKLTVAIDLTGATIRVWHGVNGVFGAGNDPLTNAGGLTLTKSASNSIFISAFSYQVVTEEVSIQASPTHTLAGYTYLV
jgi:hypothetical protein